MWRTPQVKNAVIELLFIWTSQKGNTNNPTQKYQWVCFVLIERKRSESYKRLKLKEIDT